MESRVIAALFFVRREVVNKNAPYQIVRSILRANPPATVPIMHYCFMNTARFCRGIALQSGFPV